MEVILIKITDNCLLIVLFHTVWFGKYWWVSVTYNKYKYNYSTTTLPMNLKFNHFLGGNAFWGVGVLMTLDQQQFILMLMWLNVLFGLTGKT